MKRTWPRLAALSANEAGSVSTRRGIVLGMLGGLGAVIAAVISGVRFPAGIFAGRGYERVASWKFPGGEGLFIATEAGPTPEDLRILGSKLRDEFRDRHNMVVMIFDDARAAREVSRGSRIIGEEKFQAALAHQRAMYLKETDRKEHSLTIYARYPVKREVIRL